MHLARIGAVCLPEHLASVRVLEKAGIQIEGVLHRYLVWRARQCDLLMDAITGTKEGLEK